MPLRSPLKPLLDFGETLKPAILLQHASERLRKERSVVLAAVASDWNALKFASEELKADRVIVLAAVAQYGDALQHASAELKNDKHIVLAAVSSSAVSF